MQLQLPVLNFSTMHLKMKESNGKVVIYDPCRRKYVQLTPEEWVRQHCIAFLHQTKGIPISMLSVEKAIILNTLSLRYDIVAYSKKAAPLLLVECKAPEVKITPSVFDQITVYNLQLKVPFLFVSNGFEHFFCKVDFESSKWRFVKDLPDYKSMSCEILPV
jgi:type I site-specific restriction endonuclease